MKIFILSSVISAMFFSSVVLSNTIKDNEDGRFQIHIVTIGIGEDLFARFGHIGMVVEDRLERTKNLYNFGTFDFSDPNLKLRYAKGYLNFWLSVVPLYQTILFYKSMDREITLRTLNLTSRQAELLAGKLIINARPENSVYAYRHYLDNCCTRIRDILDESVNGAISSYAAHTPVKRTFRYWTRRALRGLNVLQTAILFFLGPSVDRQITRYDEYFLPEVLSDDLDKIMINRNGKEIPLVKIKRNIWKSKSTFLSSGGGTETWIVIILSGLFALSFLIAIVAKAPLSNRFAGGLLLLWGILSGLGGLFLTLFWTITAHTDTHFNENLLLMFPVSLWLTGPGIKLIFKARLKKRTLSFIKWYIIFSLGLVFFDSVMKTGPFIQNNLEFIFASAAVNLAILAVLHRNKNNLTG